MRDVVSEHADRMTEANRKLLSDLSAVRDAVGHELGARLATLAETGRAIIDALDGVIADATESVANALSDNLMAAQASEAALRSELEQRLAFLATGRLPESQTQVEVTTGAAPLESEKRVEQREGAL